MLWQLSHKAEERSRLLADRHYNRQKPGTAQFCPPGRTVVLYAISPVGQAFWVTSWPFGRYVRHRWPGAWVNSAFRNEGCALSSLLIRDAIAATRFYWPIPVRGIVTFIDPSKVRHKRDLGRCYLRAGFEYDGETKGGLVALRLRPSRCPSAAPPHLLV